MLRRINLQINKTGSNSAIIFDGHEEIAGIKNLYLCNVRLTPSSNIIISEQVPMPLFWWQYANHQDPERNTGANGLLMIVKDETDEIRFRCRSQNQSGNAKSEYLVILNYSTELESYIYTISATLIIPKGKKWCVTPNPVHGELEFCNLWPQDVFSTDAGIKKLYQACYIQTKTKIEQIPHHHLETTDKQNIEMEKGDKFLWASETINPVVEIISEQKVSTGVCAYMWDTHFGYRVTDCIHDVWLDGDKKFTANFKLYSLAEKTVTRIIHEAPSPSITEILKIPVYLSGLNTFSKTLVDFPEQFHHLWPWTFETSCRENDRIIWKVDDQIGYSDHYSLFVENMDTADSLWIATTIGPAFGEEAFLDGIRLKLSAMIKVENVNGKVDIAIRFFQPGFGNVFNISDYKIIVSEYPLAETQDWRHIEVTTSPLFPAPERVHILLRLSGTGKVWFDDVVLSREFSSI